MLQPTEILSDKKALVDPLHLSDQVYALQGAAVKVLTASENSCHELSLSLIETARTLDETIAARKELAAKLESAEKKIVTLENQLSKQDEQIRSLQEQLLSATQEYKKNGVALTNMEIENRSLKSQLATYAQEMKELRLTQAAQEAEKINAAKGEEPNDKTSFKSLLQAGYQGIRDPWK
jgi:chromosome segregation ATPase